MSKCTFGKEEVSYLGHVISKEGVKVDLEKIKSIKEWHNLTNISKLREFLGLTVYYRRFIMNYTHRIAPLSNLLKNNAFHWNEEAEKCFEALKGIISSTPVLATPEFSKPFMIECDASCYGLGAIIMQDEHSIAFKSRKLNKREQLKFTYDKEILGIMHALEKW